MIKYNITILPSAVFDILSIKNNIAKKYNDSYNAAIVVSDIFDKVDSLVIFPKRAQVRLTISGLKLRFVRAGKYTIVYYVDDNSKNVKVYGVFHSHRDIFEIIKNR